MRYKILHVVSPMAEVEVPSKILATLILDGGVMESAAVHPIFDNPEIL